MRFAWLVLVLAPLAFAFEGPAGAIPSLVDSALSQERKLYWMKCSQALASRHKSRRHALQGLVLFIANVPLEYTASRYRHVSRSEAPQELNGAAFVLMCSSLLHLSLSFRHYQDYQRDRACCRLWQEYAGR